MGIKLGCIADDLTGASDLASSLVSAGLPTIQTIGIPAGPLPTGIDAVVVALKTRSAPLDEAVGHSLAALQSLRSAGAKHIFFKYCSTFDSTPSGNIGPVLDALASACAAGFTIACPAFPATGRTVYQGHLFVGNRLLSESGMERHPLTPMTCPDLVRVLQAQSSMRVGLISLRHVQSGRIEQAARDLIDDGVGVAIADAVNDDDLERLGEYCAGLPLSSGASGLGQGVARALKSSTLERADAPLPVITGRRAVIAGSCSAATRQQIAFMARTAPSFQVRLVPDCSAEAVVAEARKWYDAQHSTAPVVIYSTADPEKVARLTELRPDASSLMEEILARIAVHIVDTGLRALIVAGGETSGAVVQRLGIERLQIGPEIDPGVPWTIASGSWGTMVLALKSGNFGSEDFMLRAWEMLP